MNIVAQRSEFAVEPWLTPLLQREGFSLGHMPLAASSAWAVEDGAVRHRSGRFFSVVGVHAVAPDGGAIALPLLDQREVGTLAFLLRRASGGGMDILAQAKAEPGNVGTFQLSPSFQATASNAARVHRGAAPPLAGWFAGEHSGEVLSDGLQSEQRSRFYGKFNRNCTLLVSGQVAHGAYHRWLPARTLLGLLGRDHLVNTDARSVLACAPWELLVPGEPFPGDGFAAELRASFRLAETRAWRPLGAVLAALAEPAAWREPPRLCPIELLSGWHWAEEGPAPEASGPFRLRHIRVRSLSREVTRWDQPIVQSAGTGQVVLPCGRWRGVLHFLFRDVAEPGFGARRELTPALCVEPGGDPEPQRFARELVAHGSERIVCRQSEEGGRFLFDENRYAVVDIGEATPTPAEYHWLSLAQVKRLLARGGCLTNEARSVLSLLLTWL